MKKLLTLLLTAALAITAATTAFADTTIQPGTNGNPNPTSGRLNVTYTVNPSYTVTIPTSVTLDSNTKSSTAKVKAENVTVPYGQSVKVALSSATGFTVKAGDNADAPTLNYQVTIPNSTTSVQSGATVLEVASDAQGKQGETTLKFDITSGIVYSGTYTGTVTFTVSVGAKTTT